MWTLLRFGCVIAVEKQRRMDAMASDLDLDVLLAPIADDGPTGADPRTNFDPASRYFRLRDARAEARAAERQADAAGSEDEAPTAQWVPVLRLATELLATEAKDIEVAAWAIEALLRIDGLAGFTAGCRLMQRLLETFWDDVHPMLDDEGLLGRLAPISGLNGESGEGTLIQPLRKLTLFERPDGSSLALWQYQQSAEVAGIGDPARQAQRIAAGVAPFEQVEAEAVSRPAIFSTLRRDAAAATTAWRELSAVVDALAGSDAPSSSRVRDLLQDITAIADRFAPAEAAPAEAGVPVGTASGGVPPVVATAAPGASGPRSIATREDALRAIDEAATFFRRTEPHSPLAYTLSEAARRGRLTWPELLEELVPDPDSRDAILRSLGIRPLPPPE
jgi:type VI secretion system protein ImpA